MGCKLKLNILQYYCFIYIDLVINKLLLLTQATTGLGSINFDNFVACAVKFQDNNGQGLGVGKDPPRPQQSCATKNRKQCEKDDSCDSNEDGICFDNIGLSSLKEGSVEPEAHIQQANQALVHTSTMLAGLTVIWLGILLM